MDSTTKPQRRRTSRKTSEAAIIRIQMTDGMGNPRWVTADLVDLSESGFSLLLRTPLKTGTTIVVRGKLGESRSGDTLNVGVRWCFEVNDGIYRAGLEFLDGKSSYDSSEAQGIPSDSGAPDWYELMQLSPNADSDTIARVYRMLAHRYHPDNTETGNSEMFLKLSEAHQILSDPQKRARYDVQHRGAKRLQWKIFDQAAAATGVEGEKRKRQGILALLHAKMMSDPEHAELNIQLLEELLGCPREHLQSALWYLKSKNYVIRGDSGRYSITIAGFDEAEAQNYAPVRGGLQLTEARKVG